MVELARDPSEQCRQLQRVVIPGEPSPPRCLNRRVAGFDFCPGPHCYTYEERVRVHPFGDGRNNWEGKPEHRVVPPTRDARQRTAFAWAAGAFGDAQTKSIEQRALRLLEEAIELYQAAAGSRDQAADLVQFVFDRPPGTVPQEVGGVSVCMLVLCAAADLSAELEEARELERVLAKPASHWKARNDAKNAAGFLAPSIGTAPAKTTGEVREEQIAFALTMKCGDRERLRVTWNHGYRLGRNDEFVAQPDATAMQDIRAWKGAVRRLWPGAEATPELLEKWVTDMRTAHAETLRMIQAAKAKIVEDRNQLRHALINAQAAHDAATRHTPRAKPIVTEEEYRLFDAIFAFGTAHREMLGSTWSQHSDLVVVAKSELLAATLAWVAARPPQDLRTPTEIANGVTDLMPTRMRFERGPFRVVNVDELTRKPKTMHRRAEPGQGRDCCTACGKLATAFDHTTEQYTYDDELFVDSTYRCTPTVLPKSPAIATGNATVSRDAYEELLKYTKLIEARHDAAQRDLTSARATLRRVEGNNESGKLIAAVDAPVPMIMHCPACHQRHVDVAFADHPHHTHACQHCGFTWRPAVANTVGVQFLPGFKDEGE